MFSIGETIRFSWLEYVQFSHVSQAKMEYDMQAG